MRELALTLENKLSDYIAKPLAVSLVLALSAQINVLTVPVPVTLQPLALLFIGLLLSPTVAGLSVSYYLIEIGCGLPVASGFSGGFLVLISPRGGYFIGFLLSVIVSAKILQTKKSFEMFFFSAVIETIVLYSCGIAWLSGLFGIEKAITVGLVPFLSEIPAFITIAVLGSYKLSQKLS